MIIPELVILDEKILETIIPEIIIPEIIILETIIPEIIILATSIRTSHICVCLTDQQASGIQILLKA